MSVEKKTEAQIEKEIKQRGGATYLLLSALADLKEEKGEDAEDLRTAAEMCREVERLNKLHKELRGMLEAKLSNIDMEIRSLQKKCPHPITEWEPDASGNNDDTTECLCCRKYL